MKGVKSDQPIAVTSRTFSRHAALREKLQTRFSNVRFNDEGRALNGPALVEFLKGCKGVIVALEPFTADVVGALPELEIISKYGVGLNNIDRSALEARKIKLGWTGGVNARSVSELALAFALGIHRNVFVTSRLMAGGEWKNEGGFQLSGKTVGIIGCGHIGKDLVRLLKPFGCRVLIHDILPMAEFCREMGGTQVSKEEVLAHSDLVSLHVPYDESTHHLIGEQELARMKPSAVLINTSRGDVVDEKALCSALSSGKLRAAAADVFSVEPPGDCDLVRLPNFFGTPHIGGSSAEAILAMGSSAIEHLVAHFLGTGR